MKIIEINEIKKIIDKAPLSMNLMFIGDTGIGKTTVIENYCKENNIFLKTLILSQLEASETLGIPVHGKRQYNGVEYDTLKTAIPEWVFELKEHKNSILFLDEFLCAQPGVMNSFLNFLSQKRVQDLDLSHVRIIAATNIGNYTFEPDTNILSRFCMFYTINTSVTEYIKENRIKYQYKDENEMIGSIFDQRSLKPRCFEQLSLVEDQEAFYWFYEGFTNTKYFRIHEDDVLNDLLIMYFTKNEDNELYHLTDVNLTCCIAILKGTYPRTRNWDNVISRFENVDIETINKIKNKLKGK